LKNGVAQSLSPMDLQVKLQKEKNNAQKSIPFNFLGVLHKE